jgi:hypothetical protein
LFLYDTSDEFISYLFSNPIDRDMRREGEESGMFNTGDINEFYFKYRNIWVNEMNCVYENLMNQLSAEAKNALEESQTAWEIEEESNLRLCGYVLNEVVGWGSGHSAMTLAQSIGRVRMRTFQLAEYYYWLTGDFNFVYESLCS